MCEEEEEESLRAFPSQGAIPLRKTGSPASAMDFSHPTRPAPRHQDQCPVPRRLMRLLIRLLLLLFRPPPPQASPHPRPHQAFPPPPHQVLLLLLLRLLLLLLLLLLLVFLHGLGPFCRIIRLPFQQFVLGWAEGMMRVRERDDEGEGEG